MKPANDKGPTPSILMDGIDVESTAHFLCLTKDAVRNICLEHEQEILRRMTSSAEDAIREFAYAEDLISLGDPEIPNALEHFMDSNNARCRYSDCIEGNLIIDDEEEDTVRVTCSTCREYLGLPPVEEVDRTTILHTDFS